MSAAEIKPDGGTKSYIATYANTSTNLQVTTFGLESVADGKTYLSRAGLIS